jgi:uncharacterized protein YbjT (DUF2867 family)
MGLRKAGGFAGEMYNPRVFWEAPSGCGLRSLLHMAVKKIIAVMGATGAQGGGLARAILGDHASEFSLRVLTRNPNSDRARALAQRGAAVTVADADIPETLKPAFEGAFGAFCLTNFWEHFSPERELAQAEAMSTAAREAGLRHVIWSTLEDTRRWIPLADDQMPTLMGKYKVPHFDAKGEANRLFTERGVPTTFMLTSFYWDNFIHFGLHPTRGQDGTLTIVFPMGDKKLPGIAVEDIGRCAFALFKAGREFVGRTIGLAGEHLTGSAMASQMSEVLGREVRYEDVSPEVYRTLPLTGAPELANMFQFKRDFQDVFCSARSVEVSRALNPSLQTFGQWLAANQHCIPLE